MFGQIIIEHLEWRPKTVTNPGLVILSVSLQNGHRQMNAPTAADETITIAEDGSHKFVEGDFNFSDTDTGDTLDHVTIVTLPGSGTLELSGVAVNAGQEISAANITNGNLEFFPDANENGDPYTSFTFSVNDGTKTVRLITQ